MNNAYKTYPLANKVLVVAVMNSIEGSGLFDWAAYVDAVAGVDHGNEMMGVARNGTKLPKELANILFPGLDITKYRG